jgi:hypothetical protein
LEDGEIEVGLPPTTTVFESSKLKDNPGGSVGDGYASVRSGIDVYVAFSVSPM